MGDSAAVSDRRPEARSPDEPVLVASHLSGHVMRDVSFTLRPGEIVGIAGLDGKRHR